ncbi:MAG TPA: hypothetical protein VMG80_06125, partial [Solirubrobacteraceae bacterium]|nr:hypothetical protein [Solirubrobacteraceae bacterium]
RPVDLSHISFQGFGRIGELETSDAELTIGEGEDLGGLEASTLKLDPATKVAFQIDGAGTTAQHDYSQVVSEGATALGGATMEVDVVPPAAGHPCPVLPVGAKYTFVQAESAGSIGAFGNAPEGTEIPVHVAAGCAPSSQTLVIGYHESAGVKTVVGTVPAPEFPLTVAVTGAGTVGSNPAGISGCGPLGGPECTAELEEGTVTLTATPEAGYAFAGWIGCKKASATTCEIDLTAATEVTAVFLEKGKEGKPGEGVEVTKFSGNEHGCQAGGLAVKSAHGAEYVCNGVKGEQGAQGASGSDGKEGAAGSTGANGAQGPAGSAGPAGPAGPSGPAGREGPAGKVQIVTCTTKGKKKTCTTRTVSGAVKFTASSMRATLSRHGLVYASGAAVKGARGGLRLRVTPLRALRAGRYTLTLTSGGGRHEHTRTEAFTLS